MATHSSSTLETRPYTRPVGLADDDFGMPKLSISADTEPFGRRLARLRKSAGYSQRTLAAELGVSYRVIAYYEAESGHIPSHLLPALADALGISADQLLGRQPVSPRQAPENRRLLRRLKLVERLPSRARTAVLEHIDALLEKHGVET
jgi:transcriptional regulator with XRE-family HTH domain